MLILQAAEELWLGLLERMPGVQELSVLAIGPELGGREGEWCGAVGERTVTIRRVGCLYHHLPATERRDAHIDLFFAFNSGIHYYESWAPTLQVRS
jgi:hypothetical protein